MMTLAQAAADTANNDVYLVWGFILLGIAIGLLLLELFVPSGGVIGLLCGVVVIGSVVSFFKFDTTFGFAAAITYAVAGPIALYFGFKVWVGSPLGKRMILGGTDEVTTAEGDTVPTAEIARRERMEKLRQLIGAEGVTITALRPVGTVRIAGQRLDALAETGIIAADTPVTVTDVYDNQIKVRPS